MKFQNIAPDVKLGKNVKILGVVNLYGCEIGDNTKIGSFSEIQKGAKIGNNCKISSHTFICEGVTIEDNVFVGHNMTFIVINILAPPQPRGNCKLKMIGFVSQQYVESPSVKMRLLVQAAW